MESFPLIHRGLVETFFRTPKASQKLRAIALKLPLSNGGTGWYHFSESEEFGGSTLFCFKFISTQDDNHRLFSRTFGWEEVWPYFVKSTEVRVVPSDLIEAFENKYDETDFEAVKEQIPTREGFELPAATTARYYPLR